MKTFEVWGRLVTSWIPLDPEVEYEYQPISVQVQAEDHRDAIAKAAQKIIETEPAKSEEGWEFLDADTSLLKAREASPAEIAEHRLKAEQKRLREDVAAHAVGTLFDMTLV